MSLREWYSGKSLLITGGTGFMGKVLIERLLRSCPKVKKIYVLCRPKRSVNPQQRIIDFAKLPLFEKVLKERPDALKQVVAVEGNLTVDGLGLSDASMKMLQNEVNVVINSGASLKLEAPLKDAIEHNTKGTQRVLDLAKTFKHLQAFVHLSTAFCHPEKAVLEEKLYEPDTDPLDVMSVTSWMDESMAAAMEPQLLKNDPNSYIFTKRLTESLVRQYANVLPLAVCRPSIVTPTLKEPMPGWVDSLNGPVGVCVAAGKGVLRSMRCNPDSNAQVAPVDSAINAIIIAAWRRAVDKHEPGDVPVYNISSGDQVVCTWRDLLERSRKIVLEYPLDPGLWFPGGTIRTNKVTHALAVFFYQLLPAYFIDFILLLAGQKRFMVYVQNRILQGMTLLEYFTLGSWNFATDKFRSLHKALNDEEKKIFYTCDVEYDIDEYIKDFILGSRVYCLKEPLSGLPRARTLLRVQYWVDKVVTNGLRLLLLYYSLSLLGSAMGIKAIGIASTK